LGRDGNGCVRVTCACGSTVYEWDRWATVAVAVVVLVPVFAAVEGGWRFVVVFLLVPCEDVTVSCELWSLVLPVE
jgi:hypothetical protein